MCREVKDAFYRHKNFIGTRKTFANTLSTVMWERQAHASALRRALPLWERFVAGTPADASAIDR
jgi:hypothetical protein